VADYRDAAMYWNMRDAFTTGRVPPMGFVKDTAAADALLTRDMTSPESSTAMTCPLLCCVPAPDPYLLPGIGTLLANTAN
jgi:hypothetical protein